MHIVCAVHDTQEAFILDMFHAEIFSATTEGSMQKILAEPASNIFTLTEFHINLAREKKNVDVFSEHYVCLFFPA